MREYYKVTKETLMKIRELSNTALAEGTVAMMNGDTDTVLRCLGKVDAVKEILIIIAKEANVL